MIAIYQGERVRVVRLSGRHSLIIWHGSLKRVHERDLEVVHAR